MRGVARGRRHAASTPAARRRRWAARATRDEQPDREQPEDEAADVGEVGDAFAVRPGWRGRRAPKYSCSRNQKPSRSTAGTSTIVTKKTMNTSVSTRARGYKQDVAAEHGGDRAGGAERGAGGAGVGGDLRAERDEPAEQVEGQEAHASHGVLDGRPEDREEHHVAEDVQEAAVQEHRGEHGLPRGGLWPRGAADPGLTLAGDRLADAGRVCAGLSARSACRGG